MNNKKYIFIGFGGLTYDLRNVLWRSRRLLFVRSLKHGINVRKISGNAVTRLPHQTTQALMTSGEDFVISNPHTCSIGEIPLCQV